MFEEFMERTRQVSALFPVVHDYSSDSPQIIDLGTEGFPLPTDWEKNLRESIANLGEEMALSLALKQNASAFGYTNYEVAKESVKKQIHHHTIMRMMKNDPEFRLNVERAFGSEWEKELLGVQNGQTLSASKSKKPTPKKR